MRKVLTGVLIACFPVLAQQVILPTYSATTAPMGDLMALAALEPTVPSAPTIRPNRQVLPTLPPSSTPDPLVKSGVSSSFKATAGLNFLGNGLTFPGFTITGEPPDTNGAVGTTQYVQWVNSAFTIFNKTTGVKIAGPTNGNVLFSALPPTSICRTTNSGDPIANFDKINSRWVLTQFAITADFGGQYGQCIAVSTTADATGTYNVYEYDFPDFDDYPKVGIWSDAYYISYNMFSHISPGNFLNAKICAYDSAGMRAGAASPATICFNTPAGQDFSLMPSDIDGLTAPPAGAPNPVWELWDVGVLRLFNFHVDFAIPANSTLTGPTAVSVASFTFVCNNFAVSATCVTQPGVAQQLDTLGDRMMYRAAYRNRGGVQSVMLSHSVDTAPGTTDLTGVRWYEMRMAEASAGAPYTTTVFQSATQAPATGEHRWMSSIAMDKIGNVLLGYSVSNGTATFPSIRVTGRTRTEPRGFMEGEFTVVAGTGSQNGHSRWGDYSAMTVDPVDDCTFWYTQEYFDAPNADFAWKTRIASFKFPNCQ